MSIILNILLVFFLAFQLVFALYLLLPFFNLVCYFFLRLFRINPVSYNKKPLTDKEFKFALVVTAHQEVDFIKPIVDSLLKQSYKNFEVYVIADDCDISHLNFADERIIILKPDIPLHSKIKSIHYGIEHFRKIPDALIIFDSDNLLHPAFLNEMNTHFQKGYRVVQADFKPKNTDSLYARMDSIGDMFNFFIEREMRMRLNVSASIWGAGCAIDYHLYKEVQYSNYLGGFDKKLQEHLVKNVDVIAFAPNAILYDEKIATGQSLEKQRTRWISSYFKYFKESFAIFLEGIKRPSFNLIYFGFITLRPPLFIVFGLSLFFLIADYFINVSYTWIWVGIFASFLFSFISIVILKGRSWSYIKTLFMLPFFVMRQVMALLKLKKAKKSFLKTSHTKVMYIEEILKH